MKVKKLKARLMLMDDNDTVWICHKTIRMTSGRKAFKKNHVYCGEFKIDDLSSLPPCLKIPTSVDEWNKCFSKIKLNKDK